MMELFRRMEVAQRKRGVCIESHQTHITKISSTIAFGFKSAGSPEHARLEMFPDVCKDDVGTRFRSVLWGAKYFDET
jgi:hypothetical protein